MLKSSLNAKTYYINTCCKASCSSTGKLASTFHLWRAEAGLAVYLISINHQQYRLFINNGWALWLNITALKSSTTYFSTIWTNTKVLRKPLPAQYLLNSIQDEDKEETRGRKERNILCWPTVKGEGHIFGCMHLCAQKKDSRQDKEGTDRKTQCSRYIDETWLIV